MGGNLFNDGDGLAFDADLAVGGGVGLQDDNGAGVGVELLAAAGGVDLLGLLLGPVGAVVGALERGDDRERADGDGDSNRDDKLKPHRAASAPSARDAGATRSTVFTPASPSIPVTTIQPHASSARSSFEASTAL